MAVSKREKVLLSLVVVTLVVIANLVLFQWLRNTELQALTRIQELRPTIQLDEFLLENRDYWLGARDWLEAQGGPSPNLNEARVALLEFAQKEAGKVGVELSSPSMPPIRTGTEDRLAEVRVGFEVSGSWQKIVQFLATLEDPPAFQGISSITLLKSRDDDIKASVTVVRYFPISKLVASP